MAKLTNKQVMEQMTDAELRAIYRIFGVRPKAETEVCTLRNFWYYFVNDFNFRIGDTKIKCRIFRERYIDVPSTEYHISGFINYTQDGYHHLGANIGKVKLKSPDDEATIERAIRKAIEKTFGKVQKEIF
ncbi:MAG: hypothetical protein IIY21_08605 [Clostridiales bacterium]|nr:hypothetical protein [Clostridiales bacterium]